VSHPFLWFLYRFETDSRRQLKIRPGFNSSPFVLCPISSTLRLLLDIAVGPRVQVVSVPVCGQIGTVASEICIQSSCTYLYRQKKGFCDQSIEVGRYRNARYRCSVEITPTDGRGLAQLTPVEITVWAVNYICAVRVYNLVTTFAYGGGGCTLEFAPPSRQTP
jgi:hypothetical protein